MERQLSQGLVAVNVTRHLLAQILANVWQLVSMAQRIELQLLQRVCRATGERAVEMGGGGEHENDLLLRPAKLFSGAL